MQVMPTVTVIVHCIAFMLLVSTWLQKLDYGMHSMLSFKTMQLLTLKLAQSVILGTEIRGDEGVNTQKTSIGTDFHTRKWVCAILLS